MAPEEESQPADEDALDVRREPCVCSLELEAEARSAGVSSRVASASASGPASLVSSTCSGAGVQTGQTPVLSMRAEQVEQVATVEL